MPIRQDSINEEVTPTLTRAFERTISPERWRTYQMAAGFDDNLAHRLYLWNAAIGQSFHFPLQSVEVALRNVVHTALAEKFGPDWCTDATCRLTLRKPQIDDLDKAERRLRRMNDADPTTAQLVASLSLGFWVSLLRRHYIAPVWETEASTAFPSLTKNESMKQVADIGENIQKLRNRIFHQEPLIGRNLSQDYADILKMLGWICSETREWTRRHSSVPKVIRERPKRNEN